MVSNSSSKNFYLIYRYVGNLILFYFITCVSIGQWSILRRYVSWAQLWVPMTIVGCTIATGLLLSLDFSFRLYSVNSILGAPEFTWNTLRAFLRSTFLGAVWGLVWGTVIGTMQWFVLRQHVDRAIGWLFLNIAIIGMVVFFTAPVSRLFLFLISRHLLLTLLLILGSFTLFIFAAAFLMKWLLQHPVSKTN
jgi:hypothetical protein